MKRILASSLLTISLLGTNQLLADEITGEMVFAKKIKAACGFKGDHLSKQFTQAQWKSFHDKHQLFETIHDLCPSIEPMKEEHLEHLYKFLYKFAKDVNEKPLC